MLCKISKNISSQIWRDIRDSEKFGVNIGEESITDNLLLKIARCREVDIAVYKFSKKEEARQGADWQWFFSSSSGNKHFGMRVQAKRIDVHSLSYRYIDHEIKDGSGRKHLQVDLLIEDAKRNPKYKLYPLYFFFNYWNDRSISRRLSNRCNTRVGGSLGWTFASAQDVRPLAIARKKQLDPDLLEVSYPIRCLFCHDEALDLPDGIQSALKEFAPNTEIPPVYNELPERIQRMMEEPSSMEDFIYSEYLRDVDGVVLIRQKQ
jgi:hypothetical protein